MADVEILSSTEDADGHRFEVAVDEAGRRTLHTVTLSHADYERWSEEGASARSVAKRLIERLLRRVRRDDLRERFDLREATQFYPAFETEIHRQFE